MATNSTALNEGVGLAANPFFSNVFLAIFILLLGFIAGKLFGLLLRRLLSEVQADKHLRALGLKVSMERFLGGFLSFVIYLLAVFFSLNTLGVASAVFTIIVLIFVFVILVSFLLAVKDFFPNLFSGLRIRFSRLFSVGDEIQIKEVKGRITSIGILEVRVASKFGEELIIPTALFTKRKIVVLKKRK